MVTKHVLPYVYTQVILKTTAADDDCSLGVTVRETNPTIALGIWTLFWPEGSGI